MITSLIICFVAAAHGYHQGIPISDQQVLIRVVEDALKSDPELEKNSNGFLHFLFAGSELSSAEDAFYNYLRIPEFQERVQDFDDALSRDPAAQDQFDAYYAALASNEPVLQGVDDLYRQQLQYPDLQRAGMAYLRAHPADALVFLANMASLAPLPEPLDEMKSFLTLRPDTRQALLACFQKLDKETATHARVFPWWATAGAPTGEVAQTFQCLERYLLTREGQFWTWHRHNVALEKDTHVRDWLRYWFRRWHRNNELAANYPEYIKIMKEAPERMAGKAEEAWPPEGPPPALLPIPPKQKPAGKPPTTKQDLMPKPPKRPVKPEKPLRIIPPLPDMPGMPQLPEKPPKPEKGDTRPERP